MKVVSSKPKGSRMYKSVTFKLTSGFNKGTKVRRPLTIRPVDIKWSFCLISGQWRLRGESYGDTMSNYYSMTWAGYNNVYSLKAALRLIRKWDVPKGTQFYVGLPFVGYEFKVTK